MGTVPEEWTGKTIGAILREARERKGISIEEAAQVTRIGKNYLHAMEDDLHDKLPNAAYTKGFIRIYAGLLGLPGDQLIARFDADFGPAPATEKISPPPQSREPKKVSKGGWYLPLLLLLLVLIASFFYRESDAPPPKKPEPVPAAVVQPPVQPAVTSAGVTPPVAPAPVAEPAEVLPEAVASAPKGGGVLKLKVNQDSLLTITVDNSFSQQYDLKAGDLIEWKGERQFTLDISNGGGVEAELNGKPLPPFGPSGKPALAVVKPGDETVSPR